MLREVGMWNITKLVNESVRSGKSVVTVGYYVDPVLRGTLVVGRDHHYLSPGHFVLVDQDSEAEGEPVSLMIEIVPVNILHHRREQKTHYRVNRTITRTQIGVIDDVNIEAPCLIFHLRGDLNKSTRIERTDTIKSLAMKLSEGHPGAVRVVFELLQDAHMIDPDSIFGAFGVLRDLDSFGIYDDRIWGLYNDVCNRNLSRTLAMLRACGLDIISESLLNAAIDSHGCGLDVEDTFRKVQEQLPNFGK